MDQILSKANNISDVKSNPYLIKLLSNPPLENFLKSQDSFIDAVDHWSKILGLLLIQLPSDQERAVIINNLYDEHGSGNSSNSHVNTFRRFMESLGHHKELELYDETTHTFEIIKYFNNQLMSYIGSAPWTASVAMIGMIELMYITISMSIHDYVKQYIPVDEISHYGLHEIMDVKHSNELFELLVPYTLSDHAYINSGLEEGSRIFNELYIELSHFL